jgi:hypothetical protein
VADREYGRDRSYLGVGSSAPLLGMYGFVSFGHGDDWEVRLAKLLANIFWPVSSNGTENGNKNRYAASHSVRRGRGATAFAPAGRTPPGELVPIHGPYGVNNSLAGSEGFRFSTVLSLSVFLTMRATARSGRSTVK